MVQHTCRCTIQAFGGVQVHYTGFSEYMIIYILSEHGLMADAFLLLYVLNWVVVEFSCRWSPCLRVAETVGSQAGATRMSHAGR